MFFDYEALLLENSPSFSSFPQVDGSVEVITVNCRPLNTNGHDIF